MKKEELVELKAKLGRLSELEKKYRDLYLRRVALGELEGTMTGYPSIDKPWLKYHSEEVIIKDIFEGTAYMRILNANKDNMDAIALTDTILDKNITYSELFDNIDLVASSFVKMGVKKADIVSVCMGNVPEVAYIFYALNKIGAVCDFMDPRATMNVMEEHLNLAKSTKLITISDCYPIFSAIKNKTKIDTIISFDPLELVRKHAPSHNLPEAPKINKADLNWYDFVKMGDKNLNIPPVEDNGEAVTILHTGGSTGEPKGALLSNKNMNALVEQWIDSKIAYEKGDKILSLMPPFVSFGLVANLHLPLSNSMQIIFIPTYEPEKTVDLIQKYKPNVIPASPAHWENVYLDNRSRNMDWSFLKVALMGGDVLNPKVEKGLNEILPCKFVQAYGMTETSTALALGFNDEVNLDGSVGAPLAKTSLEILDTETQEELGYNEIGEICALTPNRMIGYYHRDEETQNILKKHIDGNIWVHTGDLGYITKDGILFVKGRLKRIIIRHDGIKIYPIDIETKLSQMDIIKQSAVIGVRDSEHLHGENPVAYIVLKDSDIKDEYYGMIKDFCEKNLIDYSVPKDYVLVRELPYTRNGKVDFKLIKEDYTRKLKK